MYDCICPRLHNVCFHASACDYVSELCDPHSVLRAQEIYRTERARVGPTRFGLGSLHLSMLYNCDMATCSKENNV